MSRKQAPPKPEELIAKLDEKFETFREEITTVSGVGKLHSLLCDCFELLF